MTRYVADHLITMQADPTVVSPGVVDVEDGRVTFAGREADAPPAPDRLERLGGTLIPGFVNTHAHTPMVLLRGAGEGLPVDRWLVEVMWPREGKLTSDDVQWAMTLGAGELLANGITTSHEMYFFSESVIEASVAAGLRTVVTPPILIGEDLARFGNWEQQLQGMADLADRYRDHTTITVGIGPHSGYALPEAPLQAAAELASDRDLHIHIHLAEGRNEGDAVTARHGVTVPRYLESLGIFDAPRVVAAHCVWVTEDDIALLAGRDAGVAHCPISNGKHASGIAPVTDLRAAGIPVGIATDGPSSHDRLDMFEEMRAALRVARLRAGDAGAMSPAEALTMATREAADVLGRPDLGRLAPGARADMVLIASSGLGPVVDPDDLITHLVYSGSPALVRSVWVEGRQVVDSGHPMDVDMAGAREQVTQRARRLAWS